MDNSWMKLVLPMPWGRAVLLSAEPLSVPETEDRDTLNECREELGRRLNELVVKAAAYVDGEPNRRRTGTTGCAETGREKQWKNSGPTGSLRSGRD